MLEWKKLGDIAIITIGEFVHRDKQNPKAKYPVYNGGTTYTGFYDHYNNTGNKIVISARGYAGFVNRVFDNYWAGNSSYSIDVIDPNIIWHFVYYYLKNEQYNIMSMQQKGGGLAAISKKQVQELLIPVLSLPEQLHIVSILDTFTDSINNLNQQIEQRRKQYEYYRDQLLDLEGKEGVDMKMLEEIGKCYAGATPSTKNKSYWENGIIPWMSSGEVHQGIVTRTASSITQKGYDNSSTKMLPIDTVVIALAGQGKTRGSVAITAIELCTNQSLCGVVIDNDKILNKYVYHYLKTQYSNLRRISSGDGTRGGLNLKMINGYIIPIPSLAEQSRIVGILDTFEASIANLERQLAQREKQYEYYRNKLLTFE